jgi:hypothetical protein
VGFNKKKNRLAAPTGKFAGYIVSGNGFQPNPDLTRAIRDFPPPSNITDIRSFYGLCQQVDNFSNKIATALAPLSPLLKQNSGWNLGPDQGKPGRSWQCHRN